MMEIYLVENQPKTMDIPLGRIIYLNFCNLFEAAVVLFPEKTLKQIFKVQNHL
jgi:hypothetical protein